jgi:hypothetical protein
MTLLAAMTPVALAVLAWVMIVLPIVLLLGVGIAYLVGRRRSAEEIRMARAAAQADARGPDDVERGPPGGVTT